MSSIKEFRGVWYSPKKEDVKLPGVLTINQKENEIKLVLFSENNNNVVKLITKVTDYFMRNTSSMINGGYYLYKSDYINELPIVVENAPGLIQCTKLALKTNYSFLQKINLFGDFLKSQFGFEKLSKKLQNWHELEFSEFIKELNKAIKKQEKKRH